jgi:hypothetical protein
MAYIFSSAALLISVVSFFVMFFYVKNRTRADRIPQETRQEVAKIINEIDRITDRDSELIEERVKKIKSLLEDIDKHIAVYERQIENNKAVEKVQEKLSREKQNAAQDAAIEAYREFGKRNFARESAFTPQPLKVAVTENAADGDGEAADGQNRILRAAELSAAGVPNHEIAKRLGTTVNEVEMALFLASSRPS